MQTANLEHFIDSIQKPKIIAIQKIQTVLLNELQRFAFEHGFLQLMPVLMSPITDPLNHQVYPAEINYESTPLKLTASMIFHKQLALINEGIDKIWIMAPNIRLELATKKSSSNHLLEFSQFDIEMKHATMDDVMVFIEDLFKTLFTNIKTQCQAELNLLNRNLPNVTEPFLRYATDGMPCDEVDAFCDELSQKAEAPVFVTNFKREFYDKEDIRTPGIYRNFDLLYPQGYGEALSGAEREYEYEDILRRMRELDMDLKPYANYLEVAKRKLIPPSAGCGIGVQRLLKFICGEQEINKVCLFDRSINTNFIF